MSGLAPSLRLFVAVYPPPKAIAGLMSALERLDLGPKGRVADHQVHLTLQFIGDTPERHLADVQESVERATSGLAGFDIRPLRLMTLPEGPLPRLVAAETDAPAPLMEIQRRLAHRLARNARERARGRFLPHVTLQRFKTVAREVNVALSLDPFRVSDIRLVRSVLKPAGAEHLEISRVVLQ